MSNERRSKGPEKARDDIQETIEVENIRKHISEKLVKSKLESRSTFG